MNLRRLFSIASVSLVLLGAPGAHAATLALSPANGSVTVGDSITVSLFVSSSDQAMNAISAELTYPTDLLSVASISKSSSILSLWVEDPSYSNTSGTIDLSGVVPNPGFTGAGGRVVSIRFIAKKEGTAQIQFSSPAVLANDGNGTDILTSASPASITIGPATVPVGSGNESLLAVITSSTHPDETRWYDATHAILDWTNARDTSAVRLGYDNDANGSPTVSYAPAISHKELDLTDGIWYFHVQEKGSGGWGPAAAFRMQVDTVPPDPITITFPNGPTTAATTIATRFTTTDALSGIDHYTLAVDGQAFTVSAEDGSAIYALPSGDAGTHTLVVTAYDKAGNATTASARFTMTGAVSQESAWSRFVWIVANYLVIILAVLTALALIVSALWYSWHWFVLFRRRALTKEERMHVLVHRRFRELQDTLTKEIANLKKVSSRRELTLEEKRLIDHLEDLTTNGEITLDKELDEVLKKK